MPVPVAVVPVVGLDPSDLGAGGLSRTYEDEPADVGCSEEVDDGSAVPVEVVVVEVCGSGPKWISGALPSTSSAYACKILRWKLDSDLW